MSSEARGQIEYFILKIYFSGWEYNLINFLSSYKFVSCTWLVRASRPSIQKYYPSIMTFKGTSK
jgi:hypothetical protein